MSKIKKVKEIPSKIKVIKEIKEESELEKTIEKSEAEQLQEFTTANTDPSLPISERPQGNVRQTENQAAQAPQGNVNYNSQNQQNERRHYSDVVLQQRPVIPGEIDLARKFNQISPKDIPRQGINDGLEDDKKYETSKKKTKYPWEL